jgi:hypothetical protein
LYDEVKKFHILLLGYYLPQFRNSPFSADFYPSSGTINYLFVRLAFLALFGYCMAQKMFLERVM